VKNLLIFSIFYQLLPIDAIYSQISMLESVGGGFSIRPIPKHLSQVSGPVGDPDVRLEVSYEFFIHA